MGPYTTCDLERGEGLARDRSMKAYSYDDGQTWDTCELSEIVRGEPTDVVTVPPSGWENRA